MKILFISKHKHPHIGGVERHIEAVANRLQRLGHKVRIISEEDIKYPKIKIIGLIYIWFWFLKNIQLIKKADIVHIHDVFVWYLPFRFLFPRKKVYIIFHGWEGKWPIPAWNVFNKMLASFLCNGSIAVGKYIEKWYRIKADYVIYGAAQSLAVGRLSLDKQSLILRGKTKGTVVFLGRLDVDTGLLQFLQWLKTNGKRLKTVFIGEGKLKSKCKKYGIVIGNVTNVSKYLKTAEYCVPSGYLSYLEAKSFGCKIMTFANNPLKEDYWNEIKLTKTIPLWDEVVNVYIKLWE